MEVSESWNGSSSASDAMVVKWSVVQCWNFGKTDIPLERVPSANPIKKSQINASRISLSLRYRRN